MALSVNQERESFVGFEFLQKLLANFASNVSSVAANEALPDDLQAINAVLAGDRNSFSYLIEKYQSTIAAQMSRFSQEPACVEELTHDVFVEAFKALASFKAKSPLIHWLRKIAVRVGYRYWKTRKREQQRMPQVYTAEGGLDSLASQEFPDAEKAQELLSGLLEQLPPRDRLILTLIYWDSCSIEEAAKLCGWTSVMAKVQAHRARKKLRKLIEKSRNE